MTRLLTLTAAVLVLSASAFADDEIQRIDTRFKSATADETPDFRRHVVPLLGKLGCNGRACHGSFQGQGGFRLSLFGYDFKMDHEGLNERIDTDDPAASYALHKPTLQEPHEGGKRMDVDSWQYRVFHNWIKGGAKNVDAETMPGLIRVDIEPNEIVFSKSGEKVQLKAVAHWTDGTSEDVTPLCRFQSNDDQVAAINADTGLVTANKPGDTHIVAFYDKSVVPIPVMRPATDRFGPNYPDVPAPTEVDQLVINKLRKLGIVQSELCTDAEFLRRVSLDITGTLPMAKEVQAFLDDSSQDKRSRKIDELLERPSYAAWWTQKLCDYTGNSDDQLNNVTPVRSAASQNWYDWIHKRVAENMPYDKITEGIVMAVSREPDEDYREYCENLSAMYRKNDPEGSFANRTYMPHFWSRQNFRQKQDRAIAFAYTFLGTRIQCAQCHKHPFDQWTQDDFNEFTSFFTGTVAARNNQGAPDSREVAKEILAALDVDKNLRGGQLRNELGKRVQKGEVIPFGEVYSMAPKKPARIDKSKLSDDPARRKKQLAALQRKRRGNGVSASGTLLGGDKLDLTEFEDIREPLMAWLRSPKSRFAKAFVNRVWAGYFNRGIVEPTDDLSLANPPCNAELLDWLAAGFIEHDYDMKWLHRTIAGSRTYQLSWRPNETNTLDERNFSRYVPARLPAEVAYDALVAAVSSDDKTAAMHEKVDGRAIAIPGAGARRNRTAGDLGYAMRIFGRSIRESNCDCDRSEEASLLQTVFMRNDNLVLSLVDDKSGWLAQIAKESGVDFQPKVRRGGTARRPGNWKQTVERYLAGIKRLRKQGNTKRAQQTSKQLATYLKRFGISKQEIRGDDAALVENGANPKGKDSDDQPQLDVDEIVRTAYLRTLSRLPSDDEMQLAQGYVADGKGVDGVRDLLWALVNTKEFIVNH